MKKIKANINQKDRIISVNVHEGHEFYYQPVGSKKRIYLFRTNKFSGSVFAYFRDKGRNISGSEYSITLKELYNFKNYHNPQLTNTVNRIPIMVDYVLSECLDSKESYNTNTATYTKTVYTTDPESRESAA